MGRESIEEGFFVSFQCLNHFSILLGLCIERFIQLRHAWQFFVRISFFIFPLSLYFNSSYFNNLVVSICKSFVMFEGWGI